MSELPRSMQHQVVELDAPSRHFVLFLGAFLFPGQILKIDLKVESLGRL